MPRSSSEVRMTWTEKGPHGAAAPRNHENFRQRMRGKSKYSLANQSRTIGSPDLQATPAG